jgi:hypothetical protein
VLRSWLTAFKTALHCQNQMESHSSHLRLRVLHDAQLPFVAASWQH